MEATVENTVIVFKKPVTEVALLKIFELKSEFKVCVAVILGRVPCVITESNTISVDMVAKINGLSLSSFSRGLAVFDFVNTNMRITAAEALALEVRKIFKPDETRYDAF